MTINDQNNSLGNIFSDKDIFVKKCIEIIYIYIYIYIYNINYNENFSYKTCLQKSCVAITSCQNVESITINT